MEKNAIFYFCKHWQNPKQPYNYVYGVLAKVSNTVHTTLLKVDEFINSRLVFVLFGVSLVFV